jgi:hypothetical protein
MIRRLLISARDPAAAYHLTEVVKHATADSRFAVTLVAQEPALSIMRTGGLSPIPVPLEKAESQDSDAARALLAAADRLLAEHRPDAILCGLSTPFDGGIDEALLARSSVPRFLYQDFWGEQNAFFGRGPDVCLVLDRMAVEMTWNRHQLPTVVVGSARHAAYAELKPAERRTAIRRRLGIADDVVVLSLFGQALSSLDGYRRTVEAWVDAVKHLGGRRIAAYRPHPRESADDRRRTPAMFREAGIDVVDWENETVEDSLLASDVVGSAFSNCSYDAAYLNFFSESPLIVPVSLFFEPGVVEYFRQLVRLKEWPYLKSGLVLAVYRREELADELARAAGDETRRRYWLAARQNLDSPNGASGRVLDAIAARLDGTAAS